MMNGSQISLKPSRDYVKLFPMVRCLRRIIFIEKLNGAVGVPFFGGFRRANGKVSFRII